MNIITFYESKNNVKIGVILKKNVKKVWLIVEMRNCISKKIFKIFASLELYYDKTVDFMNLMC